MRKGLRIPRRFTEEGGNPYSTIEWTRRDSRITNPDGSVVFEVKDAEVPASWSQVATDIVVSKYFRKAGVPQVDDAGNQILNEDGSPVLGSETSSRQVFDRLATTWRWWGENHGYFASAHDAQAFEDEMKYMLANQIASPNSPQWFNTGLAHAYGITGTAQGFWFVDPETGEMTESPDSYSHPAPHACFINGVSDDLVNPGGIMDLWVREARLFKMGSGCTAGDSRIYVAGEGFIKIRDLFDRYAKRGRQIRDFDGKGRYIDLANEEVFTLSLDEMTSEYTLDKVELVWSYDVDKEDKLTVRFDTGAKATVSAWHPFIVWDGERIIERRADELRRGDSVLGPNETALDSVSWEPIVVDYETSYFGKSERRSVLIDSDLAWLVGYFIGDGNLGVSKAHTTNLYGTRYEYRRNRLRFFDETIENLARVQRIIERVFGEKSAMQPIAKNQSGMMLTYTGRRVTGFFSALFAPGSKTYTSSLPSFVWLGGVQLAKAFMAGLLDSDGSVSRGRATLFTASPELANDVAVLASLHGMGGGVKRSGKGSVVTVVRKSAPVGDRLEVASHMAHPGRKQRLLEHVEGRAGERASCMPLSEQLAVELFGSHKPADWLKVEIRGEQFHFGRLRYQGVVNPRKLGRAMDVLDRQDQLTERIQRIARSVAFVTSVEPCSDDPDFYDLTVSQHSNYLAGEHGLVAIHNTGSNFSQIRAENEKLSGGGKSSGVMGFLRIGDRAAGAIKSGGTTRRAAKMVILDLDHPDIEEFIDWKMHEEEKARVLIKYGGYPADFNGEAYSTVSGQNSNNSVRVPNEFIEAVRNDGDWQLRERTSGKVRKTMKARDLWRKVAEAAWACADPGVQFDTIINEWHTSPAGGKIRATNPCFTGDTRIATDKGLIQFKDMVNRVTEGETFQVYTHDATGDSPAETISLTTPTQVMITGKNQIHRLEFSDGRVLRLTPNHRLWTANRGWVRADELSETDHVRLLDQEIDFGMASWAIPVSSDARAYQAWSSRTNQVNLPEKWTEDFAHYLGWLVGDGSLTAKTAVTVYGTEEEQQTVMWIHRELLTEINGGVAPKPTKMGNGTYQLRLARHAFMNFLEALGVSRGLAGEKKVPWSVFEAPKEIVAAFLRGLYDADGCVRYGDDTRYVGLASASKELLRGAQKLLDTFGIHGSIYDIRRKSDHGFEYVTKSGEHRSYKSNPVFDLRIMGSDLSRFHSSIGFPMSIKGDILHQILNETTRYATKHWVKMQSRVEDGWETTYNLTEPKNHSYLAESVLVSNCSEYVFLDNTACNLASINLVKFYDDASNVFDTEGYEHAIRLWTIALEISVTMAHFPSREIAQGSYDYRTLGLGYANLGTLLMRMGLPYDSDAGRAVSGAITAILTGYSYATSAELSAAVGPFPRFAENREAMLRVIRNHRRGSYNVDQSEYEGLSHYVMGINPSLTPANLLTAARQSWDLALDMGERHGFRNAQVTVIAPTGCLIGGSLVPTERGLVRLRTLGDPRGSQWQDLGIKVGTDEGAKTATQFYVNGVEPVVTVETARGYRIQGTPTHRIKVVQADGTWTWKRFAEVGKDDLVPLQMNQLVGDPQVVNLPPLGDAHWTADFTTTVPRTMTPELAEFVGYFMGDGSLHAKGLRLCVTNGDFEVVERLSSLGKQLFNLEAHITNQTGYAEVAFHSVPLVMWWEACGFAKLAPVEGHTGKGWHPHIPDSVLASNDRAVYEAFVRGLFEADGYVHQQGFPSWTTTSLDFSRDVQALLLSIGYPMTRKFDLTGWGRSISAALRLANSSYNERWANEIGFISGRKQAAVMRVQNQQGSRRDYVPVSRELIDELAAENDHLRKTLLLSLSRIGMVSRRSAEILFARTGDARVGHLLGFFYDRVASADLSEEQLTYDLTVPENVTYVANGFVAHNTIGLQMDCDTTGVEPDFSLVKFKKLAGGGYFKIVNQSVTPALENLGYSDAQIEEIIRYIVGTSSLLGAPYINRESLMEKGFTDEDMFKIEAALPAVFELRHAFNPFVLGESAMQRLGFEVDEYATFEFDLLRALGFTAFEVREATEWVCGQQTIEGAPYLKDEHLAVFDTANRNGRNGQRLIHHTGHIKMLAATQPFLSGAASKTINMPNEATIEDIEESYMLSYELGVKCMALYRDGSKASQPLSSSSDDAQSEDEPEVVTRAHEIDKQILWGKIPAGLSPTQAYDQGMHPPRFLLPARRGGYTQEARVGGHKVYLRTGEYQDGTLGELFIDLAKEGATLRGILSCFAIAVSKGLQFGVPLEEFVDTFTFQTFEPRGLVEGHPNIKMANSIVDYVFRALAVEYLSRDDLAQVPPNRDGELPEPAKGLAIEAGIQLDLSDAVAEQDLSAVASAVKFLDSKPTTPPAPRSAEARKAVVMSSKDAGTAAMQSALGEMMGDAPICDVCGHITIRNGACYKCLNCGNSLGCS